MKLKTWKVEDDGWRATALFLGLVVKAYADGDWRIAGFSCDLTTGRVDGDGVRLQAAQEAAEAALARLLAEDDGLRALLGSRGTYDDFPILRTGGPEGEK